MKKICIKILLLLIAIIFIVNSYLFAEVKDNGNNVNYNTDNDFNYEKNSLFLLIEKNLEKKRFNAVKKLLDDFTEKYPEHQERKIYYNYAVVYESSSDNLQAILNYQTAIGIHPKYSQALNNLACLYQKLGRYTESEDLFLKALEANPYSPFINYNLGDMYFISKKYDLSEKYLINACKYKKNYGEAFEKLGMIQYHLKNHLRALEYLNEALKFNSTSHETCYYMGLSNYKLGQTDAAISDLKNSVKIKKNFYNGFIELGKIYTACQDYKKAIKYFFIAEAINLEDINLRILISECYYGMKRYDDAIDIIERLLRRDMVYPRDKDNKKLIELLAKVKEKKNSEPADN